jgi:hypothetical protein
MKHLVLACGLAGIFLVACSADSGTNPFDSSYYTPGGSGSGGDDSSAGSGGTAQGGTAQGGKAQGGTSQGGTAQGGTAQGGTAQGGTAQGGTAQAGQGQAGQAQAGQGQAGQGKAGSSQAGSSQAGSGPGGAAGQGAGGSGTGGSTTLNYCAAQASWACNPVGKTLCGDTGSACDIAQGGDLNCFAAPNDAGIGAPCDAGNGPFCTQGGTCINSVCVSYCCTDADCKGGVGCGMYPGSANVTVGVCGGEPGGAGGGAGMGQAGSGNAGSGQAGQGQAGSGAGGSTGGVTWTKIYGDIFGPSGTSSCTVNGGCHTNTKGGFKCGTSKSTCYTGFVNAGYVTPGSGAASSALVDPNQSPLCGTLGGNMPQVGACVTSAQINEIKSWLADGAQNN